MPIPHCAERRHKDRHVLALGLIATRWVYRAQTCVVLASLPSSKERLHLGLVRPTHLLHKVVRLGHELKRLCLLVPVLDGGKRGKFAIEPVENTQHEGGLVPEQPEQALMCLSSNDSSVKVGSEPAG